jgi:hypothetical protein
LSRQADKIWGTDRLEAGRIRTGHYAAKTGDTFGQMGISRSTRPSLERAGLSQYVGVGHNPTLLLAERLLMRLGPEIGNTTAEPNHNQRV